MVLAEISTTTLVTWSMLALAVGFVLGVVFRPWLLSDKTRREYELRLAAERDGRTTAESGLEAASGELVSMRDALAEARADVARLSSQRDAASDRVAELESSLETVTLEKNAEVERLGAEAAKVAGMERVIEEQAGRIAALETAGVPADATEETDPRIADLEHQVAAYAEKLAERDAQIEALEREEAEVAASPAMVSDKAESTRKVAEIAKRTRGDAAFTDDDLKKIRGVGPKLEELLKEMGITSYRQIANFAPDDIAHVAAALESFPDRIERDDWMKSAAELHRETYGEDL